MCNETEDEGVQRVLFTLTATLTITNNQIIQQWDFPARDIIILTARIKYHFISQTVWETKNRLSAEHVTINPIVNPQTGGKLNLEFMYIVCLTVYIKFNFTCHSQLRAQRLRTPVPPPRTPPPPPPSTAVTYVHGLHKLYLKANTLSLE
jgi:hypothetical protein